MTPAPADRLVCHENLECLLSASRGAYYHAIAREAVAYPLWAASLPAARLIPFALSRRLRPFLNDDAVLRHSDLLERLREARATAFVPSYRSSRRLERWTDADGVELVSPRWRLQRTLEDKALFHRLLQRRGLPVPPGREVTAAEGLGGLVELPAFPLVCQIPYSEGMEGTFLVRSAARLRRRLREGSLKLPLLCRRFIPGLVLGITIVVGARQLLLSAVRHQCRGLRQRSKGLAGVQWFSRAALPSGGIKQIDRSMAALGRLLSEEGFRGAANVDFILAGDEVFIIECNPRFSASTPQLAYQPSLLHGLDFFDEHVRALREQPLSAHRPRIPRSCFEGACVDFSDWTVAVMKDAGRRLASAVPELGVHDFSDERLRFVSRDVAALAGPQRLLFHHSSPAGERLGAKTDLGSLFTNFPLFSFERPRAELTGRGAALLRQLARQVRFERPQQTLDDLARLPRARRGGPRSR